MLSFACVIALAHLQGQATIPVKNGRPSRLVEMLRGSDGHSLVPSDLRMIADDRAGVVRVEGEKDQIAIVRNFVGLLDVPRPTMQLKMHIDSPADRLGYDVTTSLRSNQRWRMSDEETGISVALNPRLNSDGTVTLYLLLQYAGGQTEQIIRLKSGQKYPVDLGDNKNMKVWQRNEGGFDAAAETTALPKITFQLNLPKPVK